MFKIAAKGLRVGELRREGSELLPGRHPVGAVERRCACSPTNARLEGEPGHG